MPVALDTDVGAAAVGEWRLGAGRGLGSLAYVTVGTGIGGAVVPVDPDFGRLMHAEMGHLPARRDPRDPHLPAYARFTAIAWRDSPVVPPWWPAGAASWRHCLQGMRVAPIIAGYLGQLAASIALMLSVQRIVFGGGVMTDAAMLPLVRAAAHACLQGYLPPLKSRARVWISMCVGPALGTCSAITGGLLMAQEMQGGIHVDA